MATRGQKYRVGIFLAASTVLFVGGIVLIYGYNAESYTPYGLKFRESILGLNIGGLVEYRGVPVGSVKDIYVDEEGNARVLIEVSDAKVTLHEGVFGQIKIFSFITGAMVIELEGGDAEAPVLEPGSQIPVQGSLVGNLTITAENVMNELDTILKDVGYLAKELRGALEGLEKGAFTQIVENVDGLLVEGRDFVAEATDTMEGLDRSVQRALGEYTKLGKDLRWLVEDVGKVAENANEFIELATEKISSLDIARIQSDLDETMANVKNLTERMNGTLDLVEQVGETLLHQVDNIEHSMRDSLESLTETFNAVNDLAENLQEDPASLIRGRGRPKENP